MQTLPFVFSFLGLLSMILASLTKGEKMKLILFFVFCGNILVAMSYLLDGRGLNGAAACFLGAVQTLINYFFDSKGKILPKWLLILYAIAIIVLNVWVTKGVTTLSALVIIASLTFIMCIGQPNGARYRFWTIVNMVLWCSYDLIAPAYPSLITHIPLLIFTVVGMVIHDRKCKTE
ncbi:MAG: YgjV family protein [Ruminococcaceae bacterium]|nr:YgjV family protein [Oscillospiraceae bacterium]